MSHDECRHLDQPTTLVALRVLRRRASTRKVMLFGYLAMLAVLFAAQPVHAQIQTSGIFYAFANRPEPPSPWFVPLPPDGSDLDFFYDPISMTSNAATFEFDITPNLISGNGLEEIIVGKGGRGSVVILSDTVLRSEHLVIGDGWEDANGNPRTGTGTFRVNGFGAVYNNDPTITALLPSVQFFPGIWSTSLLGADGYDLTIGRAFAAPGGINAGATGTLWIEAGGSVEIQDAVLLGNDLGTRGTIVVDGPDSFLGSGGFDGGAAIDDHLMIIGRRGIGAMTISNGATVVTEASLVPGVAAAIFGATLGAGPADASNTPLPDEGGHGTVIVTGIPSSIPSPPEVPSKWIIGGSLQVGGFALGTGGGVGGAPFDIEGDEVQYPTDTGTGIVRIEHGGVVSVREPLALRAVGELLMVAIGFKGQIELNNGLLTIGDSDRDQFIQLLNDGVITGGGRIDTGVFNNRYLGRMTIGAGQKLTVNSTASIIVLMGDTAEPLLNHGLIELTGSADERAELEVLRTLETTTPAQPIAPFINRPLPLDSPILVADPSAYRGGIISAQDATLRFTSGIRNEGVMAFNAGTNIITGEVNNFATDHSNGRFFISEDTHVIVEGDFTSGGLGGMAPVDNPILTIRPGGLLSVLDHDSFTLTGHLDMALSRSNPARIEVAGDVGLNGDLYMSFDNDTLSTLSHGDAFELIYFAGFVGGVDLTDPMRPAPDLATNPVLNVVPDPVLAFLYPDLDFFTARILQSIYLLVLDPSMVGGGGGAVGPDFNGDGVVDLADLAIWQANQGCQVGCSVLQGDADGDGDVDGDDLLFWQRNVGLPPPWSGAGSGSGSGSGAGVPEPTGLALVLTGGMLALACRRVRRAA